MTELIKPSEAIVLLIDKTVQALNLTDVEEHIINEGAYLDDFLNDTKQRGTSFMISFQNIGELTAEYTDGDFAGFDESYIIFCYSKNAASLRDIAHALIRVYNTDSAFGDPFIESETALDDNTTETLSYTIRIRGGEVILVDKKPVLQIPVSVQLSKDRRQS